MDSFLFKCDHLHDLGRCYPLTGLGRKLNHARHSFPLTLFETHKP